MPSSITVLLVDDHAVVREGYRRLLERDPGLAVVGEAATAAQSVDLARSLNPDVVVMDIALPDGSGIAALRRIMAARSSQRVLIFSMHAEAIFAVHAFAAGAVGYLSKASAPELLVKAIHAVRAGVRFMSPDVAAAVEQHEATGRRAPLSALSPRELEILGFLVGGETVRRIGQRLGLTEKTVANMQSVIREKLGAENGVQLARIAREAGLLK
jgi:two-component system, NarL family, invasion response regulator UvrY